MIVKDRSDERRKKLTKGESYFLSINHTYRCLSLIRFRGSLAKPAGLVSDETLLGLF